MHRLNTAGYTIEVGSLLESSFAEKLIPFKDSKCFIIVDENTQEYCLEYLLTSFEGLSEAEVVVLPMGEENKQLEIVGHVWEVLTEYETTRHDLIINLGGGLITDMGGFIASCYKRGIQFINIPTTLLAMVDASIGGKTGVNLGHYKNQIGLFSTPIALYIDPIFLGTLPPEQWLSGFAEMLKHGLIHDEKLWTSVLMQMEDPTTIDQELLLACIQVKKQIVEIDPTEKNERKKLNFGHTFGHAIEGFLMEEEPITHGHAVAVGMVMEAYLSYKRGLLSQEDYQSIENALLAFYPLFTFSDDDINGVVAYLSNDKKNKSGKILTCLLERIGGCVFDQEMTEDEAMEVFMHFKHRQINPN